MGYDTRNGFYRTGTNIFLSILYVNIFGLENFSQKKKNPTHDKRFVVALPDVKWEPTSRRHGQIGPD